MVVDAVVNDKDDEGEEDYAAVAAALAPAAAVAVNVHGCFAMAAVQGPLEGRAATHRGLVVNCGALSCFSTRFFLFSMLFLFLRTTRLLFFLLIAPPAPALDPPILSLSTVLSRVPRAFCRWIFIWELTQFKSAWTLETGNSKSSPCAEAARQ